MPSRQMEFGVPNNERVLYIRKSAKQRVREGEVRPLAIASEADFERWLAAALESERKLEVHRARLGRDGEMEPPRDSVS
jgi:hypothetical protein